MKPASGKRTRAWAGTRFSNFQLANSGRYREGRLFLYVRTSGQVFSLRSKLPKVKKLLMTLPGAPKRFTVHLEVH